jgi:hypothetical protein
MSHPSDDDFAKLERLADATNADPEGMLAGKLATFLQDHPDGTGLILYSWAAFVNRPTEELNEKEKSFQRSARLLIAEFLKSQTDA